MLASTNRQNTGSSAFHRRQSIKHISCVPNLSVHTSKSTDLEDHASEVHKGPSKVHETLRLRRISYLRHQVFPIAAPVHRIVLWVAEEVLAIHHQEIHLPKTPEHMEAGLGLKLMLFFWC